MANLDDLGEDFMLCEKCKDEYDDNKRCPKLLPCLHTICSACAQTSVNNGLIQCPVCTEEHVLNNNEPLPVDSTTQNMLDMIRIQRESSGIMCSDCPDDGKGVNFCKDCYAFLCIECTTAHKRTHITRRHSITSIQGLKNSGLESFIRKNKCPHEGHLDQQLTFYCDKRDCQIPICPLCAVKEHGEVNGHVIRNLDDVCNENKAEVEKMMGEMLNEISAVSSSLNSIEALEKSVEERKREIKSKIDTLFESYENVLRERRENLKQCVDELCRAKKETIVKLHQNFSLSKTNMETACNYVSRMMAFTNPCEFLRLKGHIHRRFQSQIKCHAEKERNNAIKIEFDPQIEDKTFLEFVGNIGKIVDDGPSNMDEIELESNANITEIDRSKPEDMAKDLESEDDIELRNAQNVRLLSDLETSYIRATSPKIVSNGNSAFTPATRMPHKNNVHLRTARSLDLETGSNCLNVKEVTRSLESKSETHPLGRTQPNEVINTSSKRPNLTLNMTFPSSKAAVKISPIEDNILGRPLRLRSPVFSPRKEPVALGDFLRASLETSESQQPFNSSFQSAAGRSNGFHEYASNRQTHEASYTHDRSPVIESPSSLTQFLPVFSPTTPTTPRTPVSPLDESVISFGDIQCPDFLFDSTTAHQEREVVHDGKLLRNKKIGIGISSNDSSSISNEQFKQYKGTKGTRGFKGQGKFYFELDVTFNIQQPLEETWLVFEIGLCRLKDIDKHHTVERHEHARSFYVARYPEGGKLAQEFWHDRDLLAYVPLSENHAGLEVHVTYGFLLDARRKKWIILDVGADRILHTFDAINMSQPLYPVFGCYNPDMISVEMLLKTGSDIKRLPRCLKPY
ncbi:hypothetical protein CHS0354_011395 [Potamilus streckersoni]|uniref:Uncharacterized protein n=1 Tax=Potamilus streckersoni TaxID=2493646 RepID=A0AAE0WDM2_9BIVA|nr:hypothetical protein CHS0354_011395 [Potamilus streckersoni]